MIIYFNHNINPWNLYKNPWSLFILHHNIHNIYFQNSYKHIMIIYKKTHENITLFHSSSCYHILFEIHGYCLYLKTHGKYYSQEIFEVTI